MGAFEKLVQSVHKGSLDSSKTYSLKCLFNEKYRPLRIINEGLNRYKEANGFEKASGPEVAIRFHDKFLEVWCIGGFSAELCPGAYIFDLRKKIKVIKKISESQELIHIKNYLYIRPGNKKFCLIEVPVRKYIYHIQSDDSKDLNDLEQSIKDAFLINQNCLYISKEKLPVDLDKNLLSIQKWQEFLSE